MIADNANEERKHGQNQTARTAMNADNANEARKKTSKSSRPSASFALCVVPAVKMFSVESYS